MRSILYILAVSSEFQPSTHCIHSLSTPVVCPQTLLWLCTSVRSLRVFGTILTALDSNYSLVFQMFLKGDIVVCRATLQWAEFGFLSARCRHFTRHMFPHETENESLKIRMLGDRINFLAKKIWQIGAIILVLSAWGRAEQSHLVLNALSNLIAATPASRADRHGPNPTPIQCLQQRNQSQADFAIQYLRFLCRFFTSILSLFLFFAK